MQALLVCPENSTFAQQLFITKKAFAWLCSCSNGFLNFDFLTLWHTGDQIKNYRLDSHGKLIQQYLKFEIRN